MKIFLLGYMGSGKTTIGKALASQMDLIFMDMDVLIEAHAKHSIAEIFEIKGEEAFRKMEQTVLKSLENKTEGIIACGGGTPCFFDNIGWMKSNGLTIYLKYAPKQIIHHLKGQIVHRPILQGKSEEELLRFIEDHLHERASFYEQAHVEFEGSGTLDEVVKELRAFLQRVV